MDQMATAGEVSANQPLASAPTVDNPTVASSPDFSLVIATTPINERERRIALGVFITLLSINLIVAPFAETPLTHFDAFVPVLQTVMCFVDLLTAFLLFGQYSIFPKRALLAIASAYVFSGVFAFIQTLSFPGAYSAAGLIGDELNSANWLFVAWHTTFPLGVIVYTFSKDAKEPATPAGGSTTVTIIITLACVAVGIVLLTWLALAGSANLPSMYLSTNNWQTDFSTSANVFLWALSFVAVVLLFLRRRTILDLWLMVTLCAWWPHFIVSIFVRAVRFSLGWYTARSLALVASSTLLCVLLAETTVLYRRLARSVILLRRERTDRLMSVEAATAAMAHEITQPLAGIDAACAAGLNWVKRTPPNLEKIAASLALAQKSSRQAEDLISSIRALFKERGRQRAMIQLNEVICEALTLALHDTQLDQVLVTTKFHANMPPILADRTQLQQVFLNVIRNAIEAMRFVSPSKRRIYIVTDMNKKASVSAYIQDTGPGIAPEDRGKIFHPFYTTKSSGMGLGLAICRTIVEGHGGLLQLVRTDSNGSTFEVSFPIATTSPSGS